MRLKTLFRMFVLPLLLSLPGAGMLAACGAPPPVQPMAEPVDLAETAICALDEGMVGSDVRVTGTVSLVDSANPDGIFFEMQDGGCRVGIFLPKEREKEVAAGLIAKGKPLSAGGKLVSFDGNLIIDLAVLKPASPQAADAQPVEDAAPEPAALDLPDAPASTMLDVPLTYSGSNDLPGLCYLGSAGMLAQYAHPGLDFNDVAALSGMGSSAMHLNYPDMPSMLISPYMVQGVVFLFNNLGADYVLSYQAGGAGSDPFQPAGLPFEDSASLVVEVADASEAQALLMRAVGDGHPAAVHLDLFHVHDAFAEISAFWRDFLGKDHASHYMVVKGYDEARVYLNDPTDPTDAADELSASWDDFMAAWENTTNLPNSPPLGPFWMVFLTEGGAVPDAAAVVAHNLELAGDAPQAMRSFAGSPDDEMFTRFLLLELGTARKGYGAYLLRNGYVEAGQLYQKSGELLDAAGINGGAALNQIAQAADLEEEAVILLQ